MKNSHPILILLAAGSSTRLGTGCKKEYLKLGSGTVLSTALGAFFDFEKQTSTKFSQIIIAVPQGQEESAKDSLLQDPKICDLSLISRVHFITGGKSRQESVYKALQKSKELYDKNLPLKSEDENPAVLIHDGARPYVTVQIIKDVLDSTQKFGSAIPAIPAVDTFKDTEGTDVIQRHLVRKNLAAVQTPQGFLMHPLLLCHEKAALEEKEYTDDSEIWDAFPSITGNKKVHIVSGDTCNKKITYKEDIPSCGEKMIRVGFGTDLHKLVEGRNFVLGGVAIPSEKGELAHSDGDVLLHAISDALLGASGLGDIGSYFPPEDLKWKDADSAELLRTIWHDVKKSGWTLDNMDCVLEFEKPKFLNWRTQVIESIAKILDVESDKIFVKAKTNEKLDSIGQGLAIKAYCVCLLSKTI